MGEALRASTRRVARINSYEGVLRNEIQRIIWACGHHHYNRDTSTLTSGRSAGDCARDELFRRTGRR